MDDAYLAAVQRDLVAWGLLADGERPELSRRLRGAMARAAATLQAEEQAGRRPEGNPVERAIELALESYPMPADAQLSATHRKFLVAVEVASLPPGVRELIGV